MDINDLRKKAESVESTQAVTVQSRAEQQHVRSIEILWSTLVYRLFKHRPATFTGRERQNVRQLVAAYGIERFLSYATAAIHNWRTLCERQEFRQFPSVPTFSFFSNAHKNITPVLDSLMTKQEKEEEKKQVEIVEKEEQKRYKPTKSLSEMVAEAKQKIQEEREHAGKKSSHST